METPAPPLVPTSDPDPWLAAAHGIAQAQVRGMYELHAQLITEVQELYHRRAELEREVNELRSSACAYQGWVPPPPPPPRPLPPPRRATTAGDAECVESQCR